MITALTLGLTLVSAPDAELLLWLDANVQETLTVDGDGMVSRWSSRSDGRVAFVAEGSRRPRLIDRSSANLGPVLRFDGRDDVLRCLDFDRSAGTWTLVLTVTPRSPQTPWAGLCSGRPPTGHDYDPGFTVDLYESRDAVDSLSIEGAGRIGGQLNQLQRRYAPGTARLIVVERDREEIRLRVDGLREATRVAEPALTRMDEIRLGARYYDGEERNYLHADFSEVLLYGGILSPEELRALEGSRIDPALRLREEDWQLMERTQMEDGRMVGPQALERWPSPDALEAAIEQGLDTNLRPPLTSLPVRTDLPGAAALGVRSMTSMLDRDRDDEPFFYANLRADGTGELLHSVNIGIPHVVGRALWAAAVAHETMATPVPEEPRRILERYLKSSFANEDHLNSYLDPNRGGQRYVEFHNMREGLYGIVASLMMGDAEWARETGDLMLATLASITDDSGRWSIELARERGMADRCEGVGVPNAARLVDPLLAYHRLTTNPLALELAGQYARAGVEELFLPNGVFAPMHRSSGHVHSITSSLSGITEYALLTGDSAMLERCVAAMETGVPEYFSSWGWGDEVYPDHPADEIGRGEMNQTGDVIRSALHLGAAGHHEYYGLAERYLRSMVLPTQHTEETLAEFAREVDEPEGDFRRDVLYRAAGGYAMQLPNDRMQPGSWPLATIDITSGTVHAMAECWRHRCAVVGSEHRLNLLFDYEDEAIAVDSHLPLQGRISVQTKRDVTLCVRIPSGVDVDALSLRVNGAAAPVAVRDGYLLLPRLPGGAQAEVMFPVACRREGETVDGVVYTTLWAGDQILEILPRGPVSPLPF